MHSGRARAELGGHLCKRGGGSGVEVTYSWIDEINKQTNKQTSKDDVSHLFRDVREGRNKFDGVKTRINTVVLG